MITATTITDVTSAGTITVRRFAREAVHLARIATIRDTWPPALLPVPVSQHCSLAGWTQRATFQSTVAAKSSLEALSGR
jgi:hypothetical protein